MFGVNKPLPPWWVSPLLLPITRLSHYNNLLKSIFKLCGRGHHHCTMDWLTLLNPLYLSLRHFLESRSINIAINISQYKHTKSLFIKTNYPINYWSWSFSNNDNGTEVLEYFEWKMKVLHPNIHISPPTAPPFCEFCEDGIHNEK